MSKTTRIEEEAIQLSDSRMKLVEDEKSFTGFSWTAMSLPENSTDTGLPASVFEVAMWRKIIRLVAIVNSLTSRVKELEANVSDISERVSR